MRKSALGISWDCWGFSWLIVASGLKGRAVLTASGKLQSAAEAYGPERTQAVLGTVGCRNYPPKPCFCDITMCQDDRQYHHWQPGNDFLEDFGVLKFGVNAHVADLGR